MENLLNLSEEHMKAVFFLQHFCRFEILFKIKFLKKSPMCQGDTNMDQTMDPTFQD